MRNFDINGFWGIKLNCTINIQKIMGFCNNVLLRSLSKANGKNNEMNFLTYLQANPLTSKKVAFNLAEVFSPHCASSRKSAFTLAEVLITLGIIGIVAAMTMPSLINSYKDRAIVSKYKKAYSVLSQAMNAAQSQYSDYVYWNIVDYDMNSTTEIYNYIKPHLNIIKDCGGDSGCWAQAIDMNGESLFSTKGMGDSVYNFILNDGINVSMNVYSSQSDKTKLGIIYNELSPFIGFWIDVNGMKTPNQLGRDIFLFGLTPKGLVPAGIDNDGNDCKSGGAGYNCAIRIFREGKINY